MAPEDILRLLSGAPSLRPQLHGEIAEASQQAYAELARQQQQLRQVQEQQAKVQQLMELQRLKEQHDQVLQAF